jgi:hypothetical protein
VRLLSDMEPDELALLADADFHESIQGEARSRASDAFDTITSVMESSDDDMARLKAADKVLALAGIEEKREALPSSVSEEVFRIALAGLGKLAGIASASGFQSMILRDVSPAKADPRPLLESGLDDSPLNARPKPPIEDNEEIANLIAGERYEIFERKP